MSSSTTEQTINIPQLILVLVIGTLAIRYFFFTAPSPSSATSSQHHRSASNVRAREADVEMIQQMFPQVTRRNIMWDLQRNGGNVPATTERILSGRGLESPPQSFQPPLPVPVVSSASANGGSAAQAKSLHPDLITRYNLQTKITEAQSGSAEVEVQLPGGSGSGNGKGRQSQAWSANKGERQALLQKRRDEMILGARRKMEAKLKAEGGGS